MTHRKRVEKQTKRGRRMYRARGYTFNIKQEIENPNHNRETIN